MRSRWVSRSDTGRPDGDALVGERAAHPAGSARALRARPSAELARGHRSQAVLGIWAAVLGGFADGRRSAFGPDSHADFGERATCLACVCF